MKRNECFGRSRGSLYIPLRQSLSSALERISFALDAILETRSSCSSAILGRSRLNGWRKKEDSTSQTEESAEKSSRPSLRPTATFFLGLRSLRYAMYQYYHGFFTSMMHHADKDSVYCFALDRQLSAANKSFLGFDVDVERAIQDHDLIGGLYAYISKLYVMCGCGEVWG